MEDPQPAPAKPVPVSPPGQHGEDDPAQTPGSLPPVRRSSPGAATPLAERPGGDGQGAGEVSRAGEQLEEPHQALIADQPGATAVLHAPALAGPSAATAVTASVGPASAPAHDESAEQAAGHLYDDMPGAGSLVVSSPGLPAVGAARHASADAADEHARAAPVDADRRASVIMMDAEHTPEVSL